MNQIEIWLSIPVRKLPKWEPFTSREDLQAKVLAFIFSLWYLQVRITYFS